MCLGGHMENTHCAQICAWRSALPTETRGRAWRSRGPQHINKTHIFHMQKYQTISHTAGSPEQCKQPLYLISEPSGTCVSKMCVTPYSSSLFQQFKGPAWHLVCLCWVFFFCMKKKWSDKNMYFELLLHSFVYCHNLAHRFNDEALCFCYNYLPT